MGTLWHGGKIYTMQYEKDWTEAVYTENGRILDIGKVEVLQEKYKQAIEQTYDLNGHVMYPGFVDSHLHIIGHGEKLLHIDLSSIPSAEEVLETIQQHEYDLEEGEWLIADGWNENQWGESRIIHKDELDAIFPNNPVILSRICRHAVIVNSQALALAGISGETRDPQGGKIVRDEQGHPTGFLLDQAQELVKDVMPEISQRKLEKTIDVAIQDLLRLGLVGGHTEDLFYYGGFLKTLHAYQNILPNKYKFRAHLLVHHQVFDEMIERSLRYGDGGEFTTLGAMKIFSDGALGGRTAWLSEPYHDDEGNVGIPIHHEKDLENLIQKARTFNHPIAVHAIGDQAVEAVAKLLKKYPLESNRKDRIIHAQLANERTLKLLEDIDVILDIQPSFVASDFPWVIERIGEVRAEWSYPWRTYLQHGITCAGGSDAPIEEVNPLLGIEAAVTRKSAIDQKKYYEKEKLSIHEAISLYTIGSAAVINHAHDRGMIQKGYVADFTILDSDLYEIDPERIHEAKVVATVVDEEICYQKDEEKSQT
ncbi:amidohydrolase [Gracilibacillus sp. YIM 98692]|uniref:amidohydrolase n=1 Tax=Gracilibacillus sp. YIM 98692 TaxID=2663532 RepID=UPI0013D7AFC3|nr:amidohydrolase [Gracilibacillus sp. YIM 98692]